MTTLCPSRFLRRVLLANAAGNGALGAAAILFTSQLEDLLGLPPLVLSAAGIYLVLHAALVGWLASRETLPSAAIWALMAFNAMWSFESIVLLAFGFVRPTNLGILVVCAEAWIALLFVELQHAGMHRSTRLRTGRQDAIGQS
ncbi:MAG TPA: hypothetical protein VHL31_18750 [Geminicoccus sp.]|jgi:hypothetical protein|uniref:hypothetical protein n=1 Tax=Geminicoccus sp. TaxID=2024832 RepID=UPI002E2F7AA9|nr:hypothetical protein [Geminicoccus sp.]HEX2528326.1 hypothetical protein [Geminicoccus sp.]